MSACTASYWLAVCLILVLGPSGLGESPSTHGQKNATQVPTDRYGDPLPEGARARLGTVRFRPGTPVVWVRFAPDGKTLLSIESHGLARLWETSTGKELFHFAPPAPPQGGWSLTPDNRTLITWSNGSLRLWDTATGKLLRELTSTGHALGSACLTPDGKILVAVAVDADTDRAVFRLWDLSTGKELRDIVPEPPKEGEGPFRPVNPFFVAGGKVLGARDAGRGMWLRLWDFASGKELPVLDQERRETQSYLLSPDGKVRVDPIQEEGKGTQLQLWLFDIATGKKLRKLGPLKVEDSKHWTFSPDCRTFAAVEGNATLRLWEVASGRLLSARALHELAPVEHVVFAPDGRTVAVGIKDEEASLVLCEVSSGQVLRRLKGYFRSIYGGLSEFHAGGPIAFSSDGKLLAAAGGDYPVRLWRTADGKAIRPVSAGHEGRVRSLAVSPDGRTLASAGMDDTVRLWDLSGEREIRTLRMEPLQPGGPGAASPVCIAFTPDGKTIAAGSGGGLVQMWDAAGGKTRLRFQAHEGAVCSLAFDGRRLATGSYGEVFWWDAATGKRLYEFAAPDKPDPDSGRLEEWGWPQVVALSPDGRLLAAAGGSPRCLHLWELATGKLRRRLPRTEARKFGHPPEQGSVRVEQGYPNDVPLLAFAPDGKTAAWDQADGIQLWDLGRGKELRRIGCRSDGASGIAFSPSGVLAVSSRGPGGTIRFWDPTTGTLRGELRALRGGFDCLAFSPDGRTLLTGDSDTTILLWDVARALDEGQPGPRSLSPKELEGLWARLASPRGTEAAEAMDRLQAVPRQAVPLLGDRLRPVPAVDARQVERLLADLDSERFAVRKRAVEELQQMEERAEPFLRKRLADQPPLEVRRRLEQLLERLDGFVTGPEQVRARRAVEVLERIGAADAQQVLKALAGGALDARLTQEAQASLARLARRTATRP
jgi:WD40 repeat protein